MTKEPTEREKKERAEINKLAEKYAGMGVGGGGNWPAASDARRGDVRRGGTMKLARWDCRNESNRRYFEEWSLAQLEKLDNELVTERDIEIMELMGSGEFHKWSEQQ